MNRRPLGILLALVLVTAACALPSTGAIALDDEVEVAAGEQATVMVLRNDRPPPGETLTITSVGRAEGTVTVSATYLLYTAPEGFAGEDRFSYSVTTGDGIEVTAYVVVSVGAQPNTPTTTTTTTTVPPPADEVPPVIEAFELRPDLAALGDTITVSVAASDAESGVAIIVVRVAGEISVRCDESPCGGEIGPLPAGSTVVEAIVSDGVGNEVTDTRVVTIDAVPPEIEPIVVQPTTPSSAAPFTVTATASDANGISRVEILLDGLIVTACENSPCLTTPLGPMPAGFYTIDVAALDSVGNRETASATVEVVEARPDLVVQSFSLLGPAAPAYEFELLVPGRVVIANIGLAQAAEFGFSVSDESLRPLVVEGVVTHYPTIDGLAPGESIEVDVQIGFIYGNPGLLVAEVDSCAGAELSRPECSVVESDETNNASDPQLVDLLPVANISKPADESDLNLVGDVFQVTLDASGSFDPDGGDVTYIWTVQRASGGDLLEISSVASGVATFSLPPSCEGIFTYRFRLSVTDDEGHTTSDLRDVDWLHLC